MVSFLLRRGANPTRVPSSGMSSPLHLIIKAKDPVFSREALEALVSHGADINAYASMSNTHIPVGKDACGELGAMLVSLMDGRRLDGYAFRATPLQAACLHSRERLLKQLIEAGADVNALPETEEGFSALQIACLRGSATLFNILIDAGAVVNIAAASRFGFTALQAATLGGHTDLATRLLDLGAHVNAPSSNVVGLTALQAAAVTGDNLLVRKLLERDADVNAPVASETGKTAL
jgi:ankyrin repeat protein